MSHGNSSYRSISAACARPQQQTRGRQPLLLLLIDGTDRQTLNCFMVLTTYYVNVNVVSFLCCTLLFFGIIMFPFVVYFLQLSLTKILDCSKTSSCLKQVCVKLSTNADNVALPAFTLGCCSSRLISPACWAHSSKPQLQQWFSTVGPMPMLRQTDGRRSIS